MFKVLDVEKKVLHKCHQVILQRLCNHLEQLKPDAQPPKADDFSREAKEERENGLKDSKGLTSNGKKVKSNIN